MELACIGKKRQNAVRPHEWVMSGEWMPAIRMNLYAQSVVDLQLV